MFNWLLSQFITWFYTLIGLIRSMGETAIAALLAKVATLFPSTAASIASIETTITYINYFFPLSEAVSMGTTLLALWVAVVSYRLAKSWLPWGGA